MWFKFSENLLRERVVKRCKTAIGRGDKEGSLRFNGLLMIFLESLNNNYWETFLDVSDSLRMPEKQVERIWNICIEENVLRPFAKGFNALEWLKEKNLVGSLKTESVEIQPVAHSFVENSSNTKIAKNDFMMGFMG